MDPTRMGRLPPPFSFQTMQLPHHLQQHHQQHHPDPNIHNNNNNNNTSEEDEYSNSSGHNNNNTNSTGGALNPHHGSSGRGNIKKKGTSETGEVVRKPRGRPPGSKNKPKPPIIITRETGTGMRPHVLEVSSGCDIAECVAAFARRRQRALCVLCGSGAVSNVSLRQATAPGSTVVTLHGRFDILSLSGTFMVQSSTQQQGSSSPPNSASSTSSSLGLTISMAGAQGQVIGGSVVGALVSVSPVLIIAASFMGACFDRLPLDEHGDEMNGSQQQHQLLQMVSGGGGGGSSSSGSGMVSPSGAGGSVDPCAMALYNLPQGSLGNCQITPDILAWAAGGGRPPPF